jgi:hypothetical protein
MSSRLGPDCGKNNMATFLAYAFIFIMLGLLKLMWYFVKFIWIILTLPFQVVYKCSNEGKSSPKKEKQDDATHTEYCEFDWWQDNQGL